jgi:hypothetical protein
MKIEIDLDDIFRDDQGPDESLEESIRRQVISRLTESYRKRLFDRFDAEMAATMQKQVAEIMAANMPNLIDDIMNNSYTPVSVYGQKDGPTTFRDEIIKSIAANMKYEPKTYRSDENAFTQAVKSIVEAKTGEIKTAILAQVDTEFKRDAIAFAVTKLSERLGLSKA